jgi:uncharacterized membrane protein HdeD (DUF308 family)
MEAKTLTGGMKVLSIITAILMIIIGGSLFFAPRLIVWMFSAAVFVHGIQLIIRYFSMKENRRGWDIISGVISILFGASMLFSPSGLIFGVLAMEIFFAIWILFAGISFIGNSFVLKKEKAKSWIFQLLGGILMIICGIFCIVSPAISAIGLIFTIGIFAGVSFIISGFTILAAALSGNKDAE